MNYPDGRRVAREAGVPLKAVQAAALAALVDARAETLDS
jgi:hypothetical protein